VTKLVCREQTEIDQMFAANFKCLAVFLRKCGELQMFFTHLYGVGIAYRCDDINCHTSVNRV